MRKIKNLAIIAIITISCAWNAGAQGNPPQRRNWQDRIKAEKIAYLTDAMDLTSAEAEKFWQVYNRAESETRECWKLAMDAYRALEKSIESGKDDKEIGALLDKYLEAQEAGKGIERKYTVEYRKILSNDKIAKLYIGEENFRRQQIHKLNKNDNSKTDKR